MPGAVYLLCAGTSLLCAAMLLRAYATQRVPLLFWTGLCFLGLMLDNVFLYVDAIVFPHVNLATWTKLPPLIALILLLYGMIFDSSARPVSGQ